MPETGSDAQRKPVLRLDEATIGFHGRTLWEDLSLELVPGEFLAVLGPNGSGKSTLLKVLLGLQRLDRGRVEISGRPARRGSSRVGYIPQQQTLPVETPLRSRDLIAMGLDGHRFGLRTRPKALHDTVCLLYTSDAADE